jgi:ribosome-associated translation inhibitor RaiA/cold shock CspA family protein
MRTDIPLDIMVRNIPYSPAIETKIRQKAQGLSRYFARIEYCKIVIDVPKKHMHHGKLYTTRIEVGVPGKRLSVTHQVDPDLYVTIRDAFAAMGRQLEEYAQRQRGYVKAHEESMPGYVVRLFEDYGFIQTLEGKEFYFHKSNLLFAEFEELEIGTPVHFLESLGGDGLQATHVSIVGLNSEISEIAA